MHNISPFSILYMYMYVYMYVYAIIVQMLHYKWNSSHKVSYNYLSHSWYVCVIPSVVVHQYSPVGHGCDLVAIIPPGHDLGVLWCVLTQPVVGLAEIIKDDTRTIVLVGSKNNGGGGVSLRRHLDNTKRTGLHRFTKAQLTLYYRNILFSSMG